jgi:hypothetical protein
MFCNKADKVAFVGVKAPPEFWTNEVYPEISTEEPASPVAPGSEKSS